MDLEVSSIQQGVLMKMGSIDLIICQESSEQIPYCQVGRDVPMSWNWHEEMTEKMSSKGSLDQHVQLTKEEDRDNIMMIGGIGVFLSFSEEEAEVCVADGAATTVEQTTVTIKREEGLEQTLEVAQAEGENEHSE
jgi:hypothetical protein